MKDHNFISFVEFHIFSIYNTKLYEDNVNPFWYLDFGLEIEFKFVKLFVICHLEIVWNSHWRIWINLTALYEKIFFLLALCKLSTLSVKTDNEENM